MTTVEHNPDHYPHKDGGNADLDILCRACELGVPVRRAMPGPPECADCGRRVSPSRDFCDTCQEWRDLATAQHHDEATP